MEPPPAPLVSGKQETLHKNDEKRHDQIQFSSSERIKIHSFGGDNKYAKRTPVENTSIAAVAAISSKQWGTTWLARSASLYRGPGAEPLVRG